MTKNNPYSSPRFVNTREQLRGARNRRIAFAGFFSLNLLAAYAPALSWMAWSGIADENVIFFPVVLVLLSFWVTEAVWAWIIVATFFLLLGVASRLLYRYSVSWVLAPCTIFFFSVYQALLLANFIRGLDAIGRS